MPVRVPAAEHSSALMFPCQAIELAKAAGLQATFVDARSACDECVFDDFARAQSGSRLRIHSGFVQLYGVNISVKNILKW